MQTDAGVFAGLRVLDLTQGFAGALCTMVLGDNGASVIRVVAADDDDADPADAAAGARQWHRSKHTVRLDPRGENPVVLGRRLVREADIVVATEGAPVLGALQLSLADAVAQDPALIACMIDGFGDHPTLRHAPAHEGVVLAASGRMLDCGRSFRLGRPAYFAPPLGGFGAGNGALQGICAALHVRHHTGTGQLVRASMVRGLTIFDFFGPDGPRPVAGGPVKSALGPHPALGYIPARTKDGQWIQWANWAPHLLWRELDLLGLGGLGSDAAFAALPQVDPAGAHALWEKVLAATATRTAAEWMALLTEAGTAGGDVFRTTIEGMDHPQARFNGTVITRVEPGLGATEQIGPIADMAATPSAIGGHPWDGAPAAAPPPPASRPSARPPAATGAPLAGVVVLEAASMIATPVGSGLLADIGARVIKIEPLEGEPGRSLPFTKTLQGKESIAVDIKSPEGLAIVHRLAARADMFLHNYRPGVPEKLGIDAASLRARNPDLIYVYAGAYGKEGPYAKMPAYHPIAGAICGNALRQAGHGARDAPAGDLAALKARSLHLATANEGHPDPVTGALVATILLLGLIARDRYGVGQEITTTMLGASAYLMSADWIRFAGRPDIDEVDADHLGTGALNRLYRTDDGWVFLACPTQREWLALCAVLERPELAADPRFGDNRARHAHDAELAAALDATIGARGADELEGKALAVGLGCVRADRAGFAQFQQAEIAAGRTDMARTTQSPGVGPHWRAAPVVDMAGVGTVGGACTAGQHTVAILAELGYDRPSIDDLLARDIVRAG
jgi:crotonobetainyl-CoA:carnitine CoA-transferase CaiB-like acyl-CoA transferase